MDLRLDRRFLKETYTVGKLYVNGIYFCDTLEDRVRDLSREHKIPGETAIPAGRYRVAMTYSPKFKRSMPLLCGVPNFDAIRIHAGNSAKDTQGCILVGLNKHKGMLVTSLVYSNRLNAMISDAIKKRETVTITII